MGAKERESLSVSKTFRGSDHTSIVTYDRIIAKYLDVVGAYKVYAI